MTTGTQIDPQHSADLYDSDHPGATAGPWTLLADQRVRTDRWTEHRLLVVADADGIPWGLRYRVGLTENQEIDLPWEEADEPLPLVRLWPHEVKRIEYRDRPPVDA